MFPWSRGFCFGHPCRKLLPQIRNFFIENQKRQSNLFFGEKNRLSQSFSLDIWNAVLTTPLKIFRQETGNFSLIAQKSNCFGLCQNYFLEVLRSAGHVENIPGSSIFFWSFCGREGCGFDTTGVSVFKDYGSFSLKIGKRIKNAFFSGKNSIYSKSCSGHMECTFGNTAKIILPKTQRFSLRAQKIWKFCYFQKLVP